jgi:hypothetical protein
MRENKRAINYDHDNMYDASMRDARPLGTAAKIAQFSAASSPSPFDRRSK